MKRRHPPTLVRVGRETETRHVLAQTCTLLSLFIHMRDLYSRQGSYTWASPLGATRTLSRRQLGMEVGPRKPWRERP